MAIKTNSKAASRFQKIGLFIVVFSLIIILVYLVISDSKDTDAYQLTTVIFVSLNLILITIILPRYRKANKPTKDDSLTTISKRLFFMVGIFTSIVVFSWIVGPLLFEIVGGRSMLGFYIIIVAFIISLFGIYNFIKERFYK